MQWLLSLRGLLYYSPLFASQVCFLICGFFPYQNIMGRRSSYESFPMFVPNRTDGLISRHVLNVGNLCCLIAVVLPLCLTDGNQIVISHNCVILQACNSWGESMHILILVSTVCFFFLKRRDGLEEYSSRANILQILKSLGIKKWGFPCSWYSCDIGLPSTIEEVLYITDRCRLKLEYLRI